MYIFLTFNILLITYGIICVKQQAKVDIALSLLEGAIFGGQKQDMSVIANQACNILMVIKMADNYQDRRQERRTKKRHDLTPTTYAPATAPARGNAPARKKSKK